MIRLLAESYIRFPGNSAIALWFIVVCFLSALFCLRSKASAIAMTEILRTAKDKMTRFCSHIDISDNRFTNNPIERIVAAIPSQWFSQEAIKKIFDRFIVTLNPSLLLPKNEGFEISNLGEIVFFSSLNKDSKIQYNSFSEHRKWNSDRIDSDSDLEQNDERMRLALDATVDGIWDWDLIQNDFFWSKQVYQILGFSPIQENRNGEDFIFSRINNSDKKQFLKTVKKLSFSDSLLRIKLRIKRIDGEYKWFLLRGKFVRDPRGKPCRIVGVIVDITDYKEQEQKLQIKEELFRALFEQITLGVAFTKIDGTPILANQKLCEILGYAESELMSLNIRDLIEQKVRHNYDLREAIFSESTDAIFLVNSKTLRTVDCNPRAVELFEASGREELIDIEGHILQKRQFTPEEMEQIVREVEEKGSWSLEVEYVTQKGNEFWGNLSVKRIDVAGQKLNLVRVTDISDRKHIEQIKDEFSSTVSHELRTPLTSIYASLSLLNSGLYESHPEKQKQMLAVATRETERLVRLVNDVLDIERLASGKAELEKSICNVGELIEQSIDGIQSLAEQKQIAIIRHWSTTSIWANSDAIVQILINLLSNAIKFSPPESILKISTSIQDDNVLFRVQDRGCGIPQEQLEHIFQPFKQVKGAGRHPKGTGLGLAISQKLVHQHGGKIWAESVVGEGSTFSFTIPHSNSKSTARPPC